MEQKVVNAPYALPVSKPSEVVNNGSCRNCKCTNEVAIAVDIDDLVEFISQAGIDVRIFIRRMSINAASCTGLGTSTRGDVSYLYLRGCWNPEKNPAIALIMDWIWSLVRENRMVYFVRIGNKPEDFEEIRLKQYGTLGIDLKKSVYFRAA